MPELRTATAGDVPVLLDIFFQAVDDLAARQGRPTTRAHPGALEQMFRHLLSTDPASAAVAEDRGAVVAFGILHVRGEDGFLSFLFVLPAHQGSGLGRAVLERCLEGAGLPRRTATCADADQPVSTGLYASAGMVPRAPLYLLRGEPDADALPGLPEGSRMRALEPAAVDALDKRWLGYQRALDHAFWQGTGRQGWQLEDRDGRVVGYGYAQASGRIGPVAGEDPDHLPAILGHLARTVRVAEGWQVVAPGPAATALRALLSSGMRIDGVPAVYCADHAGPAFDRYLPMSFALL